MEIVFYWQIAKFDDLKHLQPHLSKLHSETAELIIIWFLYYRFSKKNLKVLILQITSGFWSSCLQFVINCCTRNCRVFNTAFDFCLLDYLFRMICIFLVFLLQLAKAKMFQLKYAIAECLKEGILSWDTFSQGWAISRHCPWLYKETWRFLLMLITLL